MREITSLLRAAQSGEPAAADRVYRLLYADLRRLARHRLRQAGGLTLLDTTALVHESYLRLQGASDAEFPDRAHFLAYAGRVMRHVVVDLVRSRQAARHGGGLQRVTLDTAASAGQAQADAQVLQVHQAVEALAQLEPRLAQVVELRYFGGLTETEIAAGLGITERTVQRDWAKARLFLAEALRT